MNEEIKIINTGRYTEYKNNYFASIFGIVYKNKICGYKFVPDNYDSDRKPWFQIFYDMKREMEISLPKDSFFGEDIIYTHSLENVQDILPMIPTDLFNTFPNYIVNK